MSRRRPFLLAGQQLSLRNPDMSLGEKLWQINWTLIFLTAAIGAVGFAMLYSAANGSMEPWASRQIVRFGAGLAIMFLVALVDVRVWYRYAYLIYLVAAALLVAVEVVGATGMGAQRWIDLGIIQIQPSEIMKVALVIALARYFHGVAMEEIGRPVVLVIPVVLILGPVALVLKQPDLGTGVMLAAVGAAVFFCAGVRMWKFALVGALGLGAIPVAW